MTSLEGWGSAIELRPRRLHAASVAYRLASSGYVCADQLWIRCVWPPWSVRGLNGAHWRNASTD
jgi:hypothetical protein